MSKISRQRVLLEPRRVDQRPGALLAFLRQRPDGLLFVFQLFPVGFWNCSYLAGSWPNHFR
jgi:hypothetical protein